MTGGGQNPAYEGAATFSKLPRSRTTRSWSQPLGTQPRECTDPPLPRCLHRLGATCLGNLPGKQCASPAAGAQLAWETVRSPAAGAQLAWETVRSPAAGAQLAWETVRFLRRRGATCLGNSAPPPQSGRNLPGKQCDSPDDDDQAFSRS